MSLLSSRTHVCVGVNMWLDKHICVCTYGFTEAYVYAKEYVLGDACVSVWRDMYVMGVCLAVGARRTWAPTLRTRALEHRALL
jgi:hypothetical protein